MEQTFQYNNEPTVIKTPPPPPTKTIHDVNIGKLWYIAS